jgi:hypothetical protein
MGERHASLAPSGRELSWELGYRAALGEWGLESALAYSIDAGHIDGREEARGLLFLSRRF